MTHPTQAPVVVTLDNATLQVSGGPPGLRPQLQKLIAYRAQEMPPVEVQKLIRQAMAYRHRGGSEYDIGEVYGQVGPQLEALGWPRDRLPTRIFEAVIRTPGIWDGWRSLMSAQGTCGSGLLAHVQRAVTFRLGLTCQIHDARTKPALWTRGVVGTAPDLFPFQREAVEAARATERGVFDLPPRSGKTRIAIALVHELQLPTLVVVPTRTLVSQTVDRFREFFPADQVQPATGDTSKSAKALRDLLKALVWIATPQTAAGRAGSSDSGMTGIESRQVLIIDEFHHASAATYQTISHLARNAYYRYGMTGTHYRADGRDLEMRSVLADAIYSRSIADMIDLGRLVPARVAMVRIRGEPIDGGGDPYRPGIVENAERNKMIAYAAQWLASQGRRVLVLARQVGHAKELASMIPYAAQVDGLDNDRVRPALQALETGALRVLVGTKVIGEGVDVPRADALVYAAGGRSRVGHVQDFFRVLTASEGKTHGIVVDCADTQAPALLMSAAYRLGIYRSNRFNADVIDPHELAGWLTTAVRG